MPKSPDRPRDPAGKTPRKTYRLDAETLSRIEWLMSYHSCSATAAIRFAVAESFARLSGVKPPRP